jgi:hypothetical protein
MCQPMSKYRHSRSLYQSKRQACWVRRRRPRPQPDQQTAIDTHGRRPRHSTSSAAGRGPGTPGPPNRRMPQTGGVMPAVLLCRDPPHLTPRTTGSSDIQKGSGGVEELKGRCCLGGKTYGPPSVTAGSDSEREFSERSREPVTGINLGGKFVVAVAHVPDKGVPGSDHPC